MMEQIDFGILDKYIQDEKVTDINYNGLDLWIDHLSKGRFRVDGNDIKEEIDRYCLIVANCSNHSFNRLNQVVETETDQLRISILHDSITSTGYCLSIRKTPNSCRLTSKLLMKEEYAPINVIELLKKSMKKRMNIIVSGLPGSGKTELCKYLIGSIAESERIITIEDTFELRINQIYPKKDCVSLKVNDQFTYKQAIKASLRQRPDWIALSEVRGDEVVSLLQCISCGTSLISTIHSKSAVAIIERIVQLYPSEENKKVIREYVMDVLDIGVYLSLTIGKKGIERRIEEVVQFDNNEIITLYSYSHPEKINIERLMMINE